MANTDPKRVVLENVRFSFLNVFRPIAQQEGSKPQYSASILMPKTDVQGKARLDAAVEAAIQDGIAKRWGGQRPMQVPITVYDGDGPRPTGEAFGPECHGHWVISAKANVTHKPQVLDAQLNPIINEAEIYSGMYGKVSISFWAYNPPGVNRKGISCSLEILVKTHDGEPLGAAPPDASELFTPAAPAQVQPAYQPQPQGGYQQPQYQAPAPQQAVPQAQQAQRIDPITGQPIGGIYGLN